MGCINVVGDYDYAVEVDGQDHCMVYPGLIGIVMAGEDSEEVFDEVFEVASEDGVGVIPFGQFKVMVHHLLARLGIFKRFANLLHSIIGEQLVHGENFESFGFDVGNID